ncbi:MAG TPA: methylated-DNA--[protein]-cysteine S-methyltransferase [Rhizomicrobium sp.]|nr:methylated-DNA--[protein]-cysteine S-methyltransferase [Rhizomicrobium sp.]
MSDALLLDRVKTPIGELLLVANRRGALCMLEFADKPERWRPEFRRRFDHAELKDTADPFGLATALGRYFDGEVGALDAIETDAQGTAFQRACWKNLRRIPAGTTTTYGALAKKMGKPAAMRAVGLANGANPIAIVVPCHRVVGSDGSLTGYGGGLERKRWLLAHEARNAARNDHRKAHA